MATVRPFPPVQPLLMNPILPSGDLTKFRQDIGLLRNVIQHTVADTTGLPLGVLYSIGTNQTIKQFGAINSQLSLTQTDNFLAANLNVPNNYVGITCLSAITVPTVITRGSTGIQLTQSQTIQTIINNFTRSIR